MLLWVQSAMVMEVLFLLFGINGNVVVCFGINDVVLLLVLISNGG